ncbi:MAG: molybdopterin-dependent oxidoreductase, partial [Hyphomicrobiaceae bacterium]
VSIDPLETETVRFWENHGEFNDAEPAKIQTEVFMLPSTCFAEDEGSFTNSSRTIIWHWKAGDAPGEARTDTAIMAELFLRLRDIYKKDGGKGAEPFLKVDWSFKDPKLPTADELIREINGKALVDLKDPTDPTKVVKKAGDQLDIFAQMRDDGTTSGGNWIYTGCYSSRGNLTARRDNSDPSGLNVFGLWGYAWPANRRVLYNRASADVNGKAWSERKKYIAWDGSKWAGPDVPDFPPTLAPEKGAGPFIMNPEGVSRLWVRKLMADGPFPEHYEPFESPVANLLHPKTSNTPVARVFKGDMEVFGKAKDFPYVATTYKLVEHFHFWSKHAKRNAVMQPEAFAEISEELAKEKGIKPGSWVRVWSNRGSVKCKAVVTKRIPVLKIDGKTQHVVGLPFHFGFVGETKKNIGVNSLTPYVGDANTNTPEYKAFLVDIEPLKGPAPVA